MTPAATPIPATTVLIVRDGPRGIEVFLVQRHGKSSFMPAAWVFPGGRVESGDAAPTDRITGGESVGARLGLPVGTERPWLVAGLRETLEESGLWLGSGSPPPEAARGPAPGGAFADWLDAHDLTADLDALRPWSWWVTPVAEPKRFDTRFLLVPGDGAGAHDATETVDSGWFAPRDVLAFDPANPMRLAPPTWWLLTELDALGSVAAAVASSRVRPIPRIEPILTATGRQIDLKLPGHAEHPDPGVSELPTTIAWTDAGWRAR